MLGLDWKNTLVLNGDLKQWSQFQGVQVTAGIRLEKANFDEEHAWIDDRLYS